MLGESGVGHDVLVTQHARHATERMEMIRNQKRSGDEKDVSEYDGIVMMGGDGIIMEILQGLKTRNDYDAIVDRIRFGIVGCGTRNGLAMSLLHAAKENFTLS